MFSSIYSSLSYCLSLTLCSTRRQLRRHLSYNNLNSLSAIDFTKLIMAKNNKKLYTVLIEGNVGSGKTTFLEQFNGCQNVLLATEPVQKWQNVHGHNFLGLMYNDPKRWSFAFQSIVQRTMLELHQLRPNPNQNIKIMERSVYSARNIFVENLFKDNFMSAPEYAVLDAWYQWLIENIEIECDLIIYLRTDPEIAFKRIKTRGRPEEKDISFDYIKSLHDLHEKWLNVKMSSIPNVPVVAVDANQDMESVKKQFKFVRDLITANASAIVEPQFKVKNIENDQILKDIQNNMSPNCKLLSDPTLIPSQRV
ncbi:deoxynucleoside kinase-like [Daktulosphaira vitifoliae]|uniref:deoxynucleoside kinase-like n=1 Tax=Daktulosphaira vitifoliae TaxID=58002 RepID=UPI0021A9916A|nr:deoxynucleoside kinase-like [Daktulosphaira vitifoliae]